MLFIVKNNYRECRKVGAYKRLAKDLLKFQKVKGLAWNEKEKSITKIWRCQEEMLYKHLRTTRSKKERKKERKRKAKGKTNVKLPD